MAPRFHHASAQSQPPSRSQGGIGPRKGLDTVALSCPLRLRTPPPPHEAHMLAQSHHSLSLHTVLEGKGGGQNQEAFPSLATLRLSQQEMQTWSSSCHFLHLP